MLKIVILQHAMVVVKVKGCGKSNEKLLKKYVLQYSISNKSWQHNRKQHNTVFNKQHDVKKIYKKDLEQFVTAEVAWIAVKGSPRYGRRAIFLATVSLKQSNGSSSLPRARLSIRQRIWNVVKRCKQLKCKLKKVWYTMLNKQQLNK